MSTFDRFLTSCILGALLGGLAGMSCHKTPEPPAGRDCPSACQRGRDLACDEAGPTPLGAACEEWLCKAEAMSSSRASCMSHAPDCAAWGACRSAP